MLVTRFSPLFAQKEFLRFWVSRFAGMIGSQMLMVALGEPGGPDACCAAYESM